MPRFADVLLQEVVDPFPDGAEEGRFDRVVDEHEQRLSFVVGLYELQMGDRAPRLGIIRTAAGTDEQKEQIGLVDGLQAAGYRIGSGRPRPEVFFPHERLVPEPAQLGERFFAQAAKPVLFHRTDEDFRFRQSRTRLLCAFSSIITHGRPVRYSEFPNSEDSVSYPLGKLHNLAMASIIGDRRRGRPAWQSNRWPCGEVTRSAS